MLSDFHVHTCFSADSEAKPADMVKAAVKKGMKTICITDHMDKDYVVEGKEWTFHLKDYFAVLQEIKKEKEGIIDVRIGMELGMQPHLAEYSRELVSSYSFDYVIGSVHVIGGKDPYYPDFFEERNDKEAYRAMLLETIENLKKIEDFDVLGHLDYIVRYGKNKEKEYSYSAFSDEIDTILKYLIEHGKGLEINTGGLKYGLPFAHPHPDVLKRYRELGGEMITLGSDAHKPEHVGYDFQKAKEILKSSGFVFCTEFKERKPVFSKIC